MRDTSSIRRESHVAKPVRRLIGRLLPSIACFVLFMGFAGEAAQQRTRLQHTVGLGGGGLRFDDRCVGLSGWMSSGDFFDRIEVLPKKGRLEFRKDHKRLTDFPEEILVTIEAVSSECHDKTIAAELKHIAAPAEETLNGLRFVPSWKAGSDLKPAEIISFHTLRPTADEWKAKREHPLVDFPVEKVWLYELRIRANSIPLTSSLTVEVVARDGKHVAWLTGRL